MSVVDHHLQESTVAAVVETGADEAAARRTLRGQLARLDRELITLATADFPALPVPAGPARRASPRLLDLGALERARDALAAQVEALRVTRREHFESQARARRRLEDMLLAPGDHRWVRVTNAELGEPGCKSFHVVPRLGLVGMLAGWWHVKVSSGCPLAWGWL